MGTDNILVNLAYNGSLLAHTQQTYRYAIDKITFTIIVKARKMHKIRNIKILQRREKK